MQLFEHPENPSPPGAVAEGIRTPDGVTLRVARWPSAGRNRLGTVCLVQGRAEFIEKYFETIRDLQERGFEVATLDWRGQGGSDRLIANRRRGHVDGFRDYELDLRTFMELFVFPNCRPPYYLLGHSTGGAVLLRASAWLEGRIRRMVLAAPFIDFYRLPLPRPWVRALTGGLSYLGLGGFSVPGAGRYDRSSRDFIEPDTDNVLTSDPARYGRTFTVLEAEPSLAIAAPTIGWVYAACRSMDLFAEPDFPPSVRVPTLIVAAGGDRVVSTRAAEELGLCIRGGGHVTIDGAQHELMMEADLYRNQFWAAFDAFIPGDVSTGATGAYEAEASSARAAS